MPEIVESQNISEIGKDGFAKLVGVLKGREDQRYNAVSWNGSSGELKTQVKGGILCPASSFAVVAEGIVRYKRLDSQMQENTDSLRDLSAVLSGGSEIYGQADKIDAAGLKSQVKKYVESHGGTFDENIDWQEFIKTMSIKLKAKADAIDEVDR